MFRMFVFFIVAVGVFAVTRFFPAPFHTALFHVGPAAVSISILMSVGIGGFIAYLIK